MKIITIAVRGDADDLIQPVTYSSDPAIEKFFQTTCGMSLGRFAKLLEGFATSGLTSQSFFCSLRSRVIPDDYSAEVAVSLND